MREIKAHRHAYLCAHTTATIKGNVQTPKYLFLPILRIVIFLWLDFSYSVKTDEIQLILASAVIPLRGACAQSIQLVAAVLMLSVVQFLRQWEEKLKGKPRVLPSSQAKAGINEIFPGIVESDIHPCHPKAGGVGGEDCCGGRFSILWAMCNNAAP